MKTILISLLAASTLAAAAPAMAQNINREQSTIEQRIDIGVRNGSLTRSEAVRLRAEYRDIAQLERRYRANGLSAQERRDLDRRLDLLNARVRYERNDRDTRNNRSNINREQANIEQRIEAGVRNGSLTRPEARRLKGEYRQIARLEQRYRRNGLSAWERRDLDRRLDALSARLRNERHDGDNRYRRY